MLRTDRLSLGLPVAYLLQLLMIHVPGAIAHLFPAPFLTDNLYTEIGIRLATLGSICFVAGVWLARLSFQPSAATGAGFAYPEKRRLWAFCLVGGWIVVYGLYPLHNIPSVGAVVEESGAIWIFAVLLALRYYVARGELKSVLVWGLALSVFPVLTLVNNGFLSFGVWAVTVAIAALFVSVKRLPVLVTWVFIAGFAGTNLFANYFANREELRNTVWNGASTMDQRLDAVSRIANNFTWFDPQDPLALLALDLRLNQNYFAGLAAYRIETGDADYLYGRSLEDGVLALIPRALWPEKPVTAGSGSLVTDATGLVLNADTSWGVGSVMELDINFGTPGIIIGFLLFGWALGLLDRKAALAESRGDWRTAMVCFLVGAAMVQPNGSFVDVFGGTIPAFLAGLIWSWGWSEWSARNPSRSTAAAAMTR